MITIGPTSFLLREGDSTDDDAFAYRVFQTVQEAAQAYAAPAHAQVSYNARGRATPRGCARFVNKSVNGSTINNTTPITGRIAAEIAANPYTGVMIACGTNERTRTLLQIQTDVAALMALIPSTLDLLIVGPYAWGERYPTGANVGFAGADDTALDNADTTLSAACAARVATGTTTYVSLRTLLYVNLLPAANPGNAQSGIWTSDGIHWNNAGRAVAYASAIALSVAYA